MAIHGETAAINAVFVYAITMQAIENVRFNANITIDDQSKNFSLSLYKLNIENENSTNTPSGKSNEMQNGHVKYKVENFTGLEIEKINIYVEGVRVID